MKSAMPIEVRILVDVLLVLLIGAVGYVEWNTYRSVTGDPTYKPASTTPDRPVDNRTYHPGDPQYRCANGKLWGDGSHPPCL